MSEGARGLVVVSLALLAAGCGAKEAVSLGGSIEDPSLAVEQQAIGPFLSGELGLRLALGKFAADPVTVLAPSFALVDADTFAELGLGPLPMSSVGQTFPLEIAPGKEVRVAFEVDSSDPVKLDALDLLCAAPLRVAGSVEHSLDGGSTTTVRSVSLTPDGCP
jgi:hypothetical protein